LGELEIKVWDVLDKKKEIFMGEVRLSLGMPAADIACPMPYMVYPKLTNACGAGA
jgi:hypothetical protein